MVVHCVYIVYLGAKIICSIYIYIYNTVLIKDILLLPDQILFKLIIYSLPQKKKYFDSSLKMIISSLIKVH